jgi:hypothetical protein
LTPDLAEKSFPIAVFGTLRNIPCDQGNASLMFIKKPVAHKKCFIPHFTPRGIWLNFKENACAVAELFFYSQKDWPIVLEAIDKLEGFNIKQPNYYGYQRTLMNVYLLPYDYDSEMYDMGIRIKERDLKIPKEQWTFPQIAAWVYSNNEANNLCKLNLSKIDNPIILD